MKNSFMSKKTWATVAMALSMASVDAMASGLSESDWLIGSANVEESNMVAIADNVGKFISQRPKAKDRLFKSDAVEKKIKECVKMLMTTDAGTGFMHESFHKDDPKNFTRAWFAWQNTLFGELIIKLVNDGKLDVLNSIE